MALTARVLEIRDRHTFIPVIAIRLATTLPPVDYYLRRCGYPIDGSTILLTRLDGMGAANNDAPDWNDRTFQVAHGWIVDHWHELNDGSVVDVEFILKETKVRKQSERFDSPYDPAPAGNTGPVPRSPARRRSAKR